MKQVHGHPKIGTKGACGRWKIFVGLGFGLIIMIVMKMEMVGVMISIVGLMVRLIRISGWGVVPRMTPPPSQEGST